MTTLPPELPLLHAESLRFRGPREQIVEGPESLTVTARSLVLVGDAAGLSACLLEPERIVSGHLHLLGEPPARLLQQGRLAIAPRELPVPANLRLGAALRLSAQLIDRKADDVEEVLTRLQLIEQRRRKLGELTPLQCRLSGLAHALLGAPEFVWLDDPFGGLGEEDSQLLELTLEAETAPLKWIASSSTETLWARRLVLRAEQAVRARSGALEGPLPPAQLAADTYWARFREVGEGLMTQLAEAGGEVFRMPHPQVLRIRGLSGLGIARAGRSAGSDLLELRPAD